MPFHMFIQDIFRLIAFTAYGANEFEGFGRVMRGHVKLEILRYRNFATKVTNEGGVGVFNMSIHGLLWTSNVFTVFMGARNTVRFMRPFVEFTLGSIGKRFSTDFAIVIV